MTKSTVFHSEAITAADIGTIGFSAPVTIDYTVHRKVLIAGAHSYIGESFEMYAHRHYPSNFSIDTIDMRDPSWKDTDYSKYDAVFHVAGIAHADVGNVTAEEKQRYYDVNTRLAIASAAKAKAEGVKQFVFMSSMIIYGESAGYIHPKMIKRDTLPDPATYYGDSKWQADKGIRALASENFRVAMLRPPMVYGRGSKGNYPILAKLAKTLPVFPQVKNTRSMLYIDNLCEFLCKIMLLGQGGVFFPQNAEYTQTSQMVREIAAVSGNKIIASAAFMPAVYIGSKIPGKLGIIVNKAFGNMTYDQELSEYPGLDYRVVGLKESIQKTEG